MYASVRVMIWFPICRPLFLSIGTILLLVLLLLVFLLFLIVIMSMPVMANRTFRIVMSLAGAPVEPLCSSTWSTMVSSNLIGGP